MAATVSWANEDGLAHLYFDQPDSKVNVLSTAVWRELEACIDEIAVLPGLNGVTIESKKPGIFIAGADIKELLSISQQGEAAVRALVALGLRVLGKIEQLPCPTIALIDGAALGGGMEVALACDFRILSTHPKARMGLPEINLGLIPGWGGTQRYPRLVGATEAITFLLTNGHYDHEVEVDGDLLHDIVPSDQLLTTAKNWLREDIVPGREIKANAMDRDLFANADDLEDFKDLLEDLTAPQRPAALAAIAAVIAGGEQPLAGGLSIETAHFVQLMLSPGAQGLMDQFVNKAKK